MLQKQRFFDPTLYFLLGFNGYCIYYYHENPSAFGDILMLYWGQSVMIGIFNFLDLLTTKNVIAGSMKMNDKPIDNNTGTGCAAFFFLFHYSFFHVVYLVFIVAANHSGMHPRFIGLGLAIISLELMISFFQKKLRQGKEPVNIGRLFFMPYLRIIPMHLMILLPAFLHIEASVIFLVLKTVADLIMYRLTRTKSVQAP